tara:strand:+ start:868 stop:1581 length:714 start_codon:yes stop_codon:yes gene_type:complete
MTYETEDIVKNIDPADGVDLSTVISDIMPNRYYMFKTGGPHFFSKCKKKEVVRDIYLQNIWPFIYNVKGQRDKILTGTVAKSKLNYPTVRLYHKSDMAEKRNFRSIHKIETQLRPKEIEFGMHRLTGFAFITNPDPKTHTVIDHINSNKVDYRVENLRWSTLKGNSKGCGGEVSDPDMVYQLISEQIWFHEMGSNTVKTVKDKYQEFITDGKYSEYKQQLTFKEEFERKLSEKKHEV